MFNSETDFSQLNHHFEERSLEDLLTWGLSIFGDKMVQVTSFGPTGMIILAHLARLSPGISIISIDTGFLFEETLALQEEVQQRYPVHLDIRRPFLTPKEQAHLYGPDLWKRNPDLCCQLRKVDPLQNALQDAEAWLTGLRRDQSPTRGNIPLISWDSKYNLLKLNPLATWTRKDVWTYITKHNVPYNVLHNQGYASIGCTHCTRPSINLSDERSGRWQGIQKIECGIHLQS